MSRILQACAALVMAGSVALPTRAATLGELLPLMPETVGVFGASPIFAYVDFRALERAAGVATPPSEAAFEALTEDERLDWAHAWVRAVLGPDWLRGYMTIDGSGPDKMAHRVGFDFFDIDQAFWFGAEPQKVMVFAGDGAFADPERLGAALKARGFGVETVDGVQVWHRYEDDGYSVLDEPTLADPLGDIGGARRVAVLPHVLASASNWATIKYVLAARGANPVPGSLMEALRACVSAVEARAGTDGAVVQAYAFPLRAAAGAFGPAEGGFDADYQRALSKALENLAAASGRTLPLYPLAVLADLQIGAERVDVIALPYADADTAHTASEVLTERLQRWSAPARQADGTLSDGHGAIEAVTTSDGRVRVALVGLRSSSPAAKGKDLLKASLGGPLRSWIGGIHTGSFTLLSPFGG
jgi:hypothetical protein